MRVDHQRLADRISRRRRIHSARGPQSRRQGSCGRRPRERSTTPKNGAHAQRAEIIAAHPLGVDRAHFATLGEVETILVVGKRAGIQLGMIAQLFPQGIGEILAAILPHRHLEQRLGMTHRQRFEHDGVDQREDRGVGADAERERKDRDDSESGWARSARPAWRMSANSASSGQDISVAGAFLHHAAIAEAATRAAYAFGLRHAGGVQVDRRVHRGEIPSRDRGRASDDPVGRDW